MRKGEARKYLFYSLLLFVLAVLPSLHINLGLKTYDLKRICELAVLVLAALMFITDRRAMEAFLRLDKFTWSAILLFIMLGLASTWANSGGYHSLQLLGLYLLLFCLMLYVSSLYQRNPQTFMWAMGGLLLAFGGLYILRFVIGYGMHLVIDYPLWPGQRYQSPFFGFSNMRFFNQVQVWTLPLFVAWGCDVEFENFTQNQTKTVRNIFFGMLIFWWCFIIRTASAGAILTLFIAPCITLLLFKRKSHLYIKKYLTAVLAGIVLKLILFDLVTVGGVAVSYGKSTGMGRLARWGKMLTDIMHHPLTGYGPMSFAHINPRYHAGHPHNSVLQIAYEFGLPAMFIIVGLILLGLYKWYKQCAIINDANKTDDSNIRVGISTALLAGLGYSLFSGVIVMPLSQLWLALIGGWGVGIYAGQNSSWAAVLPGGLPQQSGGSRRINKDLSGFGKLTGLALKTIVLAALLFMSYSMITEVPRLKENQHRYIMKYGGKFHPRFWQQGRLRQGYGDRGSKF